MISTSSRTTGYKKYSPSKTTRSAARRRAVTKIQAASRGYLVRKNMNKMTRTKLISLVKNNPNMYKKVMEILEKRRRALNNAMRAKFPHFFR
jgi:hypothetical protein